jgi:hypothetical protein
MLPAPVKDTGADPITIIGLASGAAVPATAFLNGGKAVSPAGALYVMWRPA